MKSNGNVTENREKAAVSIYNGNVNGCTSGLDAFEAGRGCKRVTGTDDHRSSVLRLLCLLSIVMAWVT